MMILLNIVAVIIIALGIFMIVKDNDKNAKRLDDYKPEHIVDFVKFAKTQLYLPKVQALKSIRTEFRHLSLVEALEVYELAITEKENDKYANTNNLSDNNNNSDDETDKNDQAQNDNHGDNHNDNHDDNDNNDKDNPNEKV